jgi:FKBP-type peptidyl-prolyl cis-trans isomerase 2
MDAALDGMTEGDTKTFTVTPEEGYGERITEAKTEIPRTAFPEDMDLNEGMVMPLNGPDGNILATVETITDTMVAFDLNHPLAGKDLTFDVEVLSVENA